MFLEKLKSYPMIDGKTYRFDDYLVEVTDGSIRFGVEYAGHSGGYWYIPEITESDGKLVFSGKVKYENSYTRVSKLRQILNKIDEILLFILLLPLIVVFKLCQLLIRLIRRRPKPENTTEARLYHLMEDIFGCERA